MLSIQVLYPFFKMFAILLQAIDPQTDSSPSWHQSHTGGGGYITGIIQNPKDKHIWYARCDVAGIFKSIDKGENWSPINNGMDRWYHHSVRSLAIHPTKPDILYRCSGDFRGGSLMGSIHKSKNGGDSWKEVNTKVGYFGNGPARMFGELIQVDPHYPNKVLTAGREGGIWLSEDEGENWNYVHGQDYSFATVGINPFHKLRYYAATINGILFFSEDKGRTWSVLYENRDWHFTHLEFSANDADIVYGSAIETNVSTANDRDGVTGGIYKSADGGRTFNKSMNGLPEAFQYNTLTVDKENPDIIYTAPDARPGHDLQPLPIYQSKNGGESWEVLKQGGWEDLKNYPSYIRSLQHTGWAISKIVIGLEDSNTLYMSNWYGVAKSEDGGSTWNANQYKGLETNCLENIAVYDTNVYYTVADHSPMVSSDNGVSYTSLPSTGYPSSTALTRIDNGCIIYGVRNKGGSGIFVLQNEKAESLIEFGSPSYIQALDVDKIDFTKFYGYVDGVMEGHGGLYQSKDSGLNWEKLPPLPIDGDRLPVNAEFIENELLNIVIGQRKNVVGADKLLSIDPFDSGTIFMGEWTEGIFKFTDKSQTWEKVGENLPFKNDTASVLTVIKHDPRRNGHLYAGFIREGLWKSEDSGKTWNKTFPKDESILNVTALHVGGQSGSEIYIGGEDLYWSPCMPYVSVSHDMGNTWTNIYDKTKGSLRIKGLDVNLNTGRIYIATSGNGAFYVDL